MAQQVLMGGTARPSPAELQAQALHTDNVKMAMWLFIASEVIIFGVMIAAYVVFRVYNPEIVHAVHDELGFTGKILVTFNTFLLLTSSYAMVMGLRQIQRGNAAGLNAWLSLTALLGLGFLGLQYVEYSELAHLGVTLNYTKDAYEGFGMHFYAPTAFHGAHVFFGVLLCLLVMYRASKGHYNAYRYTTVEAFGLYWHFVDVVWLVLFTVIYLI